MGKIRTSIFEHGHTAQTEKKSKVTWWNAIVFRHCKSVTLYFSPLWSVKPWSQDRLIVTGAYPGFCSMKRLEVFLLPLDGMLVHRRSLEWIYTPGWREAQGQNHVSSAQQSWALFCGISTWMSDQKRIPRVVITSFFLFPFEDDI